MTDSMMSCPGAIGGESYHSSLPSSKINGKDDYRWTRFFRELALILVLHLNIPGQAWVNLLKRVGTSQTDVDVVANQDLDPEIQVYKLLNKSEQAHQNTSDWWRVFRREVASEGNQNLTKEVEKAHEKFITGDGVDSCDSDESLQAQPSGSPPTRSPNPTPPPCVPKTSQSFEVINEEEVIKSSEEIKSKLKEEIDVEISDPEISQQIDNVRRVIQEVAGKSPQLHLSVQLAEAVSQILKMENSYRATQTLKDILEQENEFNKKERVRLTQENEALSQEIQSLKQENEELKKTSADKNLSGFDVITKREVHGCAETKEKTPAAQSDAPEGDVVNIAAYHNLQARCVKLTKQREQLVKVNHQWDTEYHNMEKALRSENQKIYQDVIAKDEEIMAGKRLIADLEKEKTEAVTMATKTVQDYDALRKKYDSEKGKCKKYHEYATRLSQQKDKLEREISRLNTVLAQEKQKAGRKPTPTSEDIQNEILLYRQQAEIFENDFRDEQREKRRLVGELEATKEELQSVKRKLKKMAEKVQMNQDEQMAHRLQAGGFIAGRNKKQEQPRGVNYAGNDRYVDAGFFSSFGSIEADGVDGGDRTPPVERAANQCPRCEAYIDNEEAFHNHLARCLMEE